MQPVAPHKKGYVPFKHREKTMEKPRHAHACCIYYTLLYAVKFVLLDWVILSLVLSACLAGARASVRGTCPYGGARRPIWRCTRLDFLLSLSYVAFSSYSSIIERSRFLVGVVCVFFLCAASAYVCNELWSN